MKHYIHTDVEAVRTYDNFRSSQLLFETALQSVLHKGIGHDDPQFFIALARKCHDLGVDEATAIMFARLHYSTMADVAERTIRNCYAETSGTFAACRTMNRDQRKQFVLDTFLKDNYRLRYNVMTRQTEYADMRRLQFTFRPVTDRVRYSMAADVAREGVSLWDSDLLHRIESDRVRDFYPMDDFLSHLPQWDKKPRIKRLAQTIPTADTEWPERFFRWFLAMVAQWMLHDAKYGNSLIPVLVGPQGCGKSQWIRSLLPEEMQAYYHDGFDLHQRAECEAMMTRYGLVNIDEFDAISARQEPVLKHLVQLSEVHINGQSARRFCSFIATSNHYDLHRDTSGSRRYIFVNVTGKINLNHRLSLAQIYAEAVAAVKSGCRTWFTASEEAAAQLSNEEFRDQDISEQLFLQHYEPLATRDEVPGGQWLMAIEIYRQLEIFSKKDLGLRRAGTFGRVLRKHCAPAGMKFGSSSRLYHVKLREV